jgi:hypothetical protein
MKMESEKKRVYCKNCTNYYITWDKKFPHGCKLWGIKSMHMPSVVVYRSKGSTCEYYKKREGNI